MRKVQEIQLPLAKRALERGQWREYRKLTKRSYQTQGFPGFALAEQMYVCGGEHVPRFFLLSAVGLPHPFTGPSWERKYMCQILSSHNKAILLSLSATKAATAAESYNLTHQNHPRWSELLKQSCSGLLLIAADMSKWALASS